MNGARTGVMIVLEGTDGSGKGTQFELLEKRLRASGYDVAAFDFPQYQKPSSYFIKRYLNGDYGSLEAVSPYICSLFYALDRFEVAPKIESELSAGKIVICNRYSGSSMAHQGAKISNAEERRGYFIWLDNLEFELLHIPRPDVSFILRVPAEIAQGLVAQKPQRTYTGKTHDIHEANLDHLQKSVEVYDDLAKLFPKDFQRLDCVRSGKVMAVEAIHNLLWEKVLPLLPPLQKENRTIASVANDKTTPTTEPASQIINFQVSGLVEPKLTHYGWVKNVAAQSTDQFFTPPNLNPETKAHYRQGLKKLIASRSEITQKLASHLASSRPGPKTSDFATWQQQIQAEVSAIVKMVLPVATITILSYPLAAVTKMLVEELARDSLPEAQAASQALAARIGSGPTAIALSPTQPAAQSATSSYEGTTASVVLLSAMPRNELDLLPELIYSSSNLSLSNLHSSISKWPFERKTEVLAAQLARQPLRVLSKVRYDWELLSSFETYCQLQQHLFVVETQELTPRYGFDVPLIVEEAGLTDLFEQSFSLSLELHSQVRKAGYDSEAQYTTLFGHRLRWRVSCTGQELLEFCQWSTNPTVSSSVKELLEQMQDKLVEAHPQIGEILRSPDVS